MVMAKSVQNRYHQSSVKEISVPAPARLMSRRIPELPSLRYGSLGAKSPVSGPLRVSSHYRSETLPRASGKKVKNGYWDEVSGCKSTRPTRRVRFTLPSPDGDTDRSDADRPTATTTANLAVKRTAGDGCYPKTRATAISTRSDAKHGNQNNNNNNTSNNRNHVASSGGAVIENTIRYNRSSFSRREVITSSNTPTGIGSSHHHHHHHHYYHYNYHQQQQEREERDLADAAGVSVAVTASPAVRTRIHPTGKYVRGTLSPTANTAAHAAPTPGGQLLLRAARDGEDGLLRDLLRRAQLVGITDSDLNATDNSGRLSDPTVGVDFFARLIEVKDGTRIKLQLWDTAGQERFRSITKSYYRNSVGALLVYDICNRTSFEHIPVWMAEAKRHIEPHRPVFALIGCKLDLVSNGGQREVSKEEAKTFADLNGMFHVETSAKTGSNVEEAFRNVTQDVYNRILSGEYKVEDGWEGIKTGFARPNGLDFNLVEAEPARTSCC